MPLIVNFHPHIEDKFASDLSKLYQPETDFPALQPSAIEKLNTLLESPDYRFYGGIFNGKLVAGALTLCSEGLTSFDFLCVREATRRRGVGSTLLDEMKRLEAARHTVALSCIIDENDTQAQAFLQANGFHAHTDQPDPATLHLICELDEL
jgi:GNAT superfamily N-acetyltransferase